MNYSFDFKLVTYRSLADALVDCATLLDNKDKGKKIKYKSYCLFWKISTLQNGNVSFLPRVMKNSKYKMEHILCYELFLSFEKKMTDL